MQCKRAGMRPATRCQHIGRLYFYSLYYYSVSIVPAYYFQFGRPHSIRTLLCFANITVWKLEGKGRNPSCGMGIARSAFVQILDSEPLVSLPTPERQAGPPGSLGSREPMVQVATRLARHTHVCLVAQYDSTRWKLCRPVQRALPEAMVRLTLGNG